METNEDFVNCFLDFVPELILSRDGPLQYISYNKAQEIYRIGDDVLETVNRLEKKHQMNMPREIVHIMLWRQLTEEIYFEVQVTNYIYKCSKCFKCIKAKNGYSYYEDGFVFRGLVALFLLKKCKGTVFFDRFYGFFYNAETIILKKLVEIYDLKMSDPFDTNLYEKTCDDCKGE